MLYYHPLRRADQARRNRHRAAVLALCLLSACGGGDASPTPTPAPTPTPVVNRPPAFTSATTVTVVEGATETGYQAAATDPDGDALTYAIAGGADAARFVITPQGRLTFATAPIFGSPADADRDNVYQVQIAANDGKAATTLALAITVRRDLVVRRIATDFDDIASIAPVSATVMLVAQRNGAIYRFDPSTGSRTLIWTISNVGGPGVISIAAAPTFAADGGFHVMFATGTGVGVATYFRLLDGSTTESYAGPGFAASAPNYPGGGWIGYDAGGTLLFATSDAGGDGDPTGSAQDNQSQLGKIIRVTRNPDPYAGASLQNWLYATVARGLHRPSGGVRFSDGVLIADQGQSEFDELDYLASDARGVNYAWPLKEGTRTVRGTAPADATDPLVQYPRAAATASGREIIGGAVGPNGSTILRGQYVFANSDGAILTIPVTSIRGGETFSAQGLERRNAFLIPDQGAIDRPVAIVAGDADTLYIVDRDGEIFSVTAGR